MKLRLFFYVFILLFTILKGQNSIEYTIFKNVCEIFEKENTLYNDKLKITNVKMWENWETSEIILDTINPLTLEEKQFLSTITKDELIQILLSNDESQFLPLEGDFIILDSIGFFSNEYRFCGNEVTFKIVKKKGEGEKLSFYNIQFKDDKMIISLRIPNKTNCKYLHCYFKHSDSKTTLELIDYYFYTNHCQHFRCKLHYIHPRDLFRITKGVDW